MGKKGKQKRSPDTPGLRHPLTPTGDNLLGGAQQEILEFETHKYLLRLYKIDIDVNVFLFLTTLCVS